LAGESHNSFDIHPVIPDAPQHHSSGEERVSATGAKQSDAVLIRDPSYATRLVRGKIPCLRRNKKDVAPRTG